MRNCIESLLPGGEEVEIIIVDDGSQKDNTLEIAREYEAKYPNICRAIHQENGGHGEAVNTGLKNANGVFFKVVDSDDWVDGDAYRQVLDTLRRFVRENEQLDMLITNFVYEKQGAKHKKTMQYRHAMPAGQVLTWDQVKHFKLGQYILMHSVIYRAQMLRDAGLSLPAHTFYVDNIFVYQPLPHVNGRIDQQLLVTRLMLDYYDMSKVQPVRLRKYMVKYLEIMMGICSILAIRSGTEENLEKKKKIWQYLREKDLRLFIRLRWGFLGQYMNLPGKSGRKMASVGYKIAQKFYGFN